MAVRRCGVLNTAILPLAITMMAGPQIMSAIIFVTSEKAVKNSLAFVIGVLVATAIGVAAFRGLQSLVGGAVDFGDPSDNGSTGHIIQYALIALLVAFAIKNYVRRETIEPPKWLGKLRGADTKQALRPPCSVFFSLGHHLEQNSDSLGAAVPFVLLTTLIAALPLLGYLLFHRRAVHAMPKLRDWMNSNSWLVNIIVCGIFIILII